MPSFEVLLKDSDGLVQTVDACSVIEQARTFSTEMLGGKSQNFLVSLLEIIDHQAARIAAFEATRKR